MLDKVKDFRSEHPKMFLGVIGVLIVLLMVFFAQLQKSDAPKPGDPSGPDTSLPSGIVQINDPNSPEATSSSGINGGTDQMLAQMQPDLEQQFGKAPAGFIWDQQGNPISLGIKSMTSEDVVYGYTKALSNLDLGTAQKLSRNASVVSTYNDYFSSNGTSTNTDYQDIFKREVFKTAMQSLQNSGVSDTSVFADTKRSYTVKGSMIDLTNKDFWLKDKDTLFNQIYQYDQVQGDGTKASQYVENYILSYYKSSAVKTTPITYNITVQKYPDINTGWLVSIDTDLNDLLTNAGGSTVESYIMAQYQQYKTSKGGK